MGIPRQVAIRRAPRSERGFTLTEMMVTIAIVAVLSAVAVSAPDEMEANVDGTAGELSGEFDAARLRAMSSHRWQRVVFAGQVASIQQGDSLGMVLPTAWTQLATITIDSDVRLTAIAAASAVEAGGTVPAAGTGLATGVVFAPDGSSVARTLYLQTRNARQPTRVIVFEATGSVLVRGGW